jgi:hypothetical protein
MSEPIRGTLRRGARPLLASLGLILAQAAAAQGQPACLGEDAPATLSGKLQARTIDAAYLRDFPAVSKGPFYVLDLDRPICFKGSFSDAVLKDVRSIHVYSLDKAKRQLLKKHDNRHVSVRFVSLFEGHTAHHMRPVVGQVESIAPLGKTKR